MMLFSGQVNPRSRGKTGLLAISESEIIKVNPNRQNKLMEIGGWDKLELGTLNLAVNPEIVEQLKTIPAFWYEDPNTISIPDEYPDYEIHFIRGGYNYFKCAVQGQNASYGAILRIAAKKPLKRTVELYADIKLRTHLGVTDGDWLSVKIFIRNET